MAQGSIPFSQIVAQAMDIVVVTSANGLEEPEPAIVHVNEAFCEVTGYRPEEVIGRSPRLLQGPDTDGTTRQAIRAALVSRQPVQTKILNYAKDGSPYWIELRIIPLRDEEGHVTHFASVGRLSKDATEVPEPLDRYALTDPTTGLCNKRAFLDSAEREWAEFRRTGRPLSLALLDVDYFAHINDAFGRQGGDMVLRALATWTLQIQRGTDLVARVDDDELAILLPEAKGTDAIKVMERLRTNVENLPVAFAGTAIDFTVSIGVATAKGPEGGFARLLSEAKDALRRATAEGGNTLRASEAIEQEAAA